MHRYNSQVAWLSFSGHKIGIEWCAPSMIVVAKLERQNSLFINTCGKETQFCNGLAKLQQFCVYVVNAIKAQSPVAKNFTFIHRFIAHSSMQVRNAFKARHYGTDHNATLTSNSYYINCIHCTNLKATLLQLNSKRTRKCLSAPKLLERYK